MSHLPLSRNQKIQETHTGRLRDTDRPSALATLCVISPACFAAVSSLCRTNPERMGQCRSFDIWAIQLALPTALQCCYNRSWYLGCVRSVSPYFIASIIMAIMIREMPASKVFPHPWPKDLYILGPASGSSPPPMLRSTVLVL